MPIYQYKARDEEGRIISGKMDVSGEEDLQSRLESSGLFLVRFFLERKSIFTEDLAKRFLPVTARDFYTLTLQLANTVSTGVPLLASLRSIAQGCKSKKLAATLKVVIEDIESGSSFSEALSKHPRVFSKFYVSMVQLGEASGTLPAILYRLSEYIKKEMEIQRRVMFAMSYPTILCVIGAGIVVYILTAIMPQFVDIYKDEGITLPVPTTLLLALSKLLTVHWKLPVLLLIGIIFGFNMFVRTPYGRLAVDRFKLRIPFIGELQKKICAKKFIDGLYFLYTSGLPILQSLNIVKSTMRNRHFEKIIDSLQVHISAGKDLASFLRLPEFFPTDILAMIKSGEEAGTMQTMLEKASDIYQEEVNYSIERLISSFEIGIILVMGVGVAFVAMAILFPIFRLGRGLLGR